MIMYVTEFGDCCTGRIIEDFGYGRRQETLKRGMLECCYSLNRDEVDGKKELGYKYSDLRNLGLIFATTTTQQTEANEFLKSVGFKRCGSPAAKGRHQESELIGWYIKSSTLYRWWKKNNV